MGIPVVHNSMWLKELGGIYEQLYYRDNSISGAVDAFRNLQQLWDKGWMATPPREQLEMQFGMKRSAVCNDWSAALATAVASAPAAAAASATHLPSLSSSKPTFNICFAYM